FGSTLQRRNYLKKLINYFLFEGTGVKDNKYPAEKVLEIAYPSNPSTWKLLNKNEAFEKLWANMKFIIFRSFSFRGNIEYSIINSYKIRIQ
ncbi:unnamed protein product, partial [marine sediment metagenome]